MVLNSALKVIQYEFLFNTKTQRPILSNYFCHFI